LGGRGNTGRGRLNLKGDSAAGAVGDGVDEEGGSGEFGSSCSSEGE